MYYQLFCLYCLFVVSLIAARDFHRASMARQKRQSLPKTFNLRCSLYSLVLCSLALEMGFFFFSQSDGFGFTLAGRNWTEKHWHPINKYGYRDAEYPPEIEQLCKKILVVGDSFVAGHGIENISDRFVDHIRREFEPDYCTYAISQNGWNTIDEMRAVQAFPSKPDVVILSYGLNDIGGVLPDESRWYPKAPSQSLVKGLVEQSYFLNFLFWRMFRITSLQGSNYMQQMVSAYENPQHWQALTAHLEKLIDHTRSQRAEIVVVVWPWLRSVELSKPTTGKIAEYFREKNVTTVDLSEVLGGRAPSSLVVNSVDGHPNVATHQEVFQVMLPAIRAAL